MSPYKYYLLHRPERKVGEVDTVDTVEASPSKPTELLRTAYGAPGQSKRSLPVVGI